MDWVELFLLLELARILSESSRSNEISSPISMMFYMDNAIDHQFHDIIFYLTSIHVEE